MSLPAYSLTINVPPRKRFSKELMRYTQFCKFTNDEKIEYLNFLYDYVQKKVFNKYHFDYMTPVIEYTKTGNPHMHVYFVGEDVSEDELSECLHDVNNIYSANKSSLCFFITKTKVDITYWKEYMMKDFLMNLPLPVHDFE